MLKELKVKKIIKCEQSYGCISRVKTKPILIAITMETTKIVD
jgi:hypothetical protein